MLCFVEYTPDGRRAISARPRLELHLSHVAISTRNDDIEGRLYRNSENEFQHPSFISTDLMWENRYFARVRHAGILYIYISQCPRFCETCKGGKKKKMRKEKGSEQTPGIIFLIPLFSPLSVSGRILRVWIINSLPAFDLYGLSLLSNYMRDLSFCGAHSFNSISAFHLVWNPTSLATITHSEFESYFWLK